MLLLLLVLLILLVRLLLLVLVCLESYTLCRRNFCGACEGPSYGGTTILRGLEGVGISVVLVRAPLTVALRFSAQSILFWWCL